MKVKKKTAIVFKLTGNFAFALASMLLDLKRVSSPFFDEIIVFHDGISRKQKRLLHSILPVRFICYKFPIRSLSVRLSPPVLYFTPLVFASFECIKLLEEFENVIQLDYDQIVLRDFSELAEGPFSMRVCQLNAHVRVMLREEIDGYDLDRRGFLTLAFNDSLPKRQELYEFCYEELRRNARKLLMPEMAIFSFMVEKFSITLDYVPVEVYTPHPRDATEAAKILHGHSFPKFWNGLENAQWEGNYRQWLSMGGAPYKSGRVYELVRKLRAAIFS